jgi:hypothetical protein
MSKTGRKAAGKGASAAAGNGRAKSTAGSALSHRPMSKKANLSSAQADRAVGRYLSKMAG